jgi:hypothetical protein
MRRLQNHFLILLSLLAFAAVPATASAGGSPGGGGGATEQGDGTGLPTHGEKDFFMVGRKFPSATRAPIKIPHLIYTITAQEYGSPTTMSGNSWKRKPDPSWWTNQPHKIVIANRNANSAQDPGPGGEGRYGAASEKEYYAYFKERLEQGYDGLNIDEYSWSRGHGVAWQKYTFNPLRKLQNEFPNALIFAWTTHFKAGANNVNAVARNHDAFDMIMSESYITCDGKSITWYRDLAAFYKTAGDSYKQLGLTGKAMMGINIGRPTAKCPKPSQKDFDRMLTEIRKQVPFAPHIVLWGKWKPWEDPTRWDGYMASIQREIFDKAPAAKFTSPSIDATISGTITVKAEGIRNGDTNVPIAGYRFFVDNVLMQVGAKHTFNWNTSSISKGKHILTVHAVDEKWLAGAAQIEVNVQ